MVGGALLPVMNRVIFCLTSSSASTPLILRELDVQIDVVTVLLTRTSGLVVC